MNARELVDTIANNLSTARIIAKVTGVSWALTLVNAVERVTDSEEEREQLATYLRWLPMFSGSEAPSEPKLPSSISEFRDDLEKARQACCDCDDIDCGNPT